MHMDLRDQIPRPQIVTVPSGEEFVFLPRKEYDALIVALDDALEDLADIATYDRAKAELTKDPDSILPADLSSIILKGHRRLAAIRIWRALAMEDLASKSNIKPADIVEFESGARQPTAQEAGRLAAVLSVPASWLAP